jgi:hypothetical protein
LQLLAVAPAQSKPGSTVEQYVVFAIFSDFEASDTIEIHNGRTVNPAKSRLIKVLSKVRHAASNEVRPWSNVQTGVVVRSLDPIDLGDFQEQNLSGTLDDKAVHLSRKIFAKPDTFLGTVQSLAKSRVAEGFQQIIKRAGFESAQRVLIVRCHEDESGWLVSAKQFQHVEPVAFRHLNV